MTARIISVRSDMSLKREIIVLYSVVLSVTDDVIATINDHYVKAERRNSNSIDKKATALYDQKLSAVWMIPWTHATSIRKLLLLSLVVVTSKGARSENFVDCVGCRREPITLTTLPVRRTPYSVLRILL